MINRASLDPSLLAQPEPRSHGALVQEMARTQTRLGRLARAAAVAEAAPDAGTSDRIARLADAQATAGALAAAHQLEITSERLSAMSRLAAAARADDLAQRTRDHAGNQFESLKWQALMALRSAAGTMRTAGAWQLHADPGQVSLSLSAASIGTPDQAAAATAALNAALESVETLRRDLTASTPESNGAESLDAEALAERIAKQAAKSAAAQANIAPANARLLLS